MGTDKLAEAKARLEAAREAFLESLQGAQSPEHISDPLARERAKLAGDEYAQATKALIDLVLDAGRRQRSVARKTPAKD